jgi:hypothetical protein
MRHRIAPYLIVLLLALLFSVLPAAIWPDMGTPMDRWDNWYWRDQRSPRPVFRGDSRPFALRAEERLFRVLVVPPTAAAHRLGVWQGSYGAFVLPGMSTEDPAVLPPFALALQHFRLAFPFWLIVCAALYEFARAMRRRSSRKVAVA